MRYPRGYYGVQKYLIESQHEADRKRTLRDPYPKTTEAQRKRGGETRASALRLAAVLREEKS